MNNITFMQAAELIDIAAKEDRLWHFNGGDAYIRVSNDSQALMIVNIVNVQRDPEISFHDGTEYFKNYAGAQFEHSRRMREHDRTMAEHYAGVLASLETV